MTWCLTQLSPSPISLFFKAAPPPYPLSSQYNSFFRNFSVTTTLYLTAFVFRLKFYWGFFILSKQIYPFLLHIFVVYVFCLNVYLFYYFFSNKLVIWIYEFVHVMVYFRFCKIIFVCKLLKLISNYRLRCVVIK
jgi:hypothetical protein